MGAPSGERLRVNRVPDNLIGRIRLRELFGAARGTTNGPVLSALVDVYRLQQLSHFIPQQELLKDVLAAHMDRMSEKLRTDGSYAFSLRRVQQAVRMIAGDDHTITMEEQILQTFQDHAKAANIQLPSLPSQD